VFHGQEKSMSNWVTLKPEDLLPDEPPRKGPHSWTTIPGMAWPTYCRHCGHVPLRNWISRLVTRLGCGYEQDAQYRLWQRTHRAPE
jgi:hypothetical protein